MKLGPVQKKWIASLRAHPERQKTRSLGSRNVHHGSDGPYRACCLGELVLVRHRLMKKRFPFHSDGTLREFAPRSNTRAPSFHSLRYTYEKYGLRSHDGRIEHDKVIQYTGGLVGYVSDWPNCLAIMNDRGWSWPEIADFIEKNPEAVFTHSV